MSSPQDPPDMFLPEIQDCGIEDEQSRLPLWEMAEGINGKNKMQPAKAPQRKGYCCGRSGWGAAGLAYQISNGVTVLKPVQDSQNDNGEQNHWENRIPEDARVERRTESLGEQNSRRYSCRTENRIIGRTEFWKWFCSHPTGANQYSCRRETDYLEIESKSTVLPQACRTFCCCHTSVALPKAIVSKEDILKNISISSKTENPATDLLHQISTKHPR
ncbi:hypothetical protein SKAU_G00127980 [Synaphobranchus kaupii]|uniref:Uncharacterized protein n=1 Tax=Synaphobranchus kaupii TaxID=118154 RepID=A0A9Q1FPY8_SYNKA|nr:hypothetical protein SKAU_G00127980 [Synaphobranchus kaupii]